MKTSDILEIGKEQEIEPDDYVNLAKANKAIYELAKADSIESVDDIIAYFKGYAMGLNEAEARQA